MMGVINRGKCLHSLINEMTLVHRYDDDVDVSANGQKQTYEYVRSITLHNHKTKVIEYMQSHII